ncbi:MAG: hypothetical protein OYH77_03585 [Pseudomonadota bacterium]|nr:hypothetical protein [Pseudomonadota bacterium]
MTVFDPIISKVESLVTMVRHKLLGANNERLDFLMDSFYKLDAKNKNIVLISIVASIVLFIGFTIVFYLAQINSLEDRLANSLLALQRLQERQSHHQQVHQQFTSIASEVARKSQTLQMKPLLEKIARSLAVQLEGLNESEDNLASDDPLNKYLTQRKIEVRLPRISIPKLLKFLAQVEKSPHMLRVSDLTIRSVYGTKLYFNATTTIHWYKGA